MLSSIRERVSTALRLVLRQQLQIRSSVLQTGLALFLKEQGLVLGGFSCAENRLVLQIRKPGLVLGATGVVGIVLADPEVDWPARTVSFELLSGASLDAARLQRIVAALGLGLLEAVQGEHFILKRALAGRDEVTFSGNRVIVHLDKLPYQLSDIPLLGARVRLDALRVQQDGVLLRFGWA